MAYNVLKGKVEGSVDQHANQEIGGIKIFKNTISASMFYDTDAESPCATMKDVAIQKLVGGSPTALLTYQGEGTAKSEFNLTFDGTELKTKEVRAQKLYGSAAGLTNLPATKFSEPIPANHIKVGRSLRNARTLLEVKPSEGLHITEDGLGVLTDTKGGLVFKNKKLVSDPKNCLDVTAGGQNLSDDDYLLIHDASRGAPRRTTLTNFYSSYINSKSLQPEGAPYSVQLKGSKGLAGSPAFVFDPNTKVLNVGGDMRTDVLHVHETAVMEGAVVHNIEVIKSARYEIKENDYTVLCDTTDDVVTVVLPPPSETVGRVLCIKKVNSNQYKLNSNVLHVEAQESKIDRHDRLTLKYNYSSVYVQSGGDAWYLISKTGS